MGQRILTVNAGSSSVKFALYKSDTSPECLARGQVQGIGSSPSFKFKKGGSGATKPVDAKNQDQALDVILSEITPLLDGQEVAGVGHRIVHGGPLRAAPAELTEDVLADLATFNPLAPLHQPHNLSAVEAAKRAFPQVSSTTNLRFTLTSSSQESPVINCSSLVSEQKKSWIISAAFAAVSCRAVICCVC